MPPPIGVVIEAMGVVQKYRYMLVALYVVQVYDWLICFNDEYLHVHKARWTSVKIAFLTCRYFPLLIWPYHIWGVVGDHPREVCVKVAHSMWITFPFLALPPVVVFVIRAYAFTGRKKIVLAVLMSGWIALFISYLWINIAQYTIIMEFQKLFQRNTACVASRPVDANVTAHVADSLAIYQTCQLVFDSLVVALVITHCIRFRIMMGALGRSFVFQTLMSYGALLVVHVLFLYAQVSPDRKGDFVYASAFIIPNVMACRLILTLRRQVNPSPTEDDRLNSQMVRDAIAGLPLTKVDDAAHDNQLIESWD